VIVSNLAALELVGGITVSGEALTLSGMGIGGVGGAFRNVSGDNIWSGTITMGGTLGIGIGSTSGRLSLTGSPAIAASTYGLKIYGSVGGVVELVGETLFTGELELLGGTLQLGGNERITDASAVKFNGGTLFTAGFSESLGRVSISENSTLMMGAVSHRLSFSSVGTFITGKTLTVQGWLGVYSNIGGATLPNLEKTGMLKTSSTRFISLNGVLSSVGVINQYGQIKVSGQSGTAGNLYIGSLLSVANLGQIKFFNTAAGTTHFSAQLGTYEVVPDYTR
jgi:hypothetical protein